MHRYLWAGALLVHCFALIIKAAGFHRNALSASAADQYELQ
jgi:hypothetical protein